MKAPTLRHRAATICEEAKVERPAIQMGQSGCKHYWEIDRATAQVSKGICKLCGSHKQFPNYLSDCIAGPDKESYREWQDMLATSDSAIQTLEGAEEAGVSSRDRGEGAGPLDVAPLGAWELRLCPYSVAWMLFGKKIGGLPAKMACRETEVSVGIHANTTFSRKGRVGLLLDLPSHRCLPMSWQALTHAREVSCSSPSRNRLSM